MTGPNLQEEHNQQHKSEDSREECSLIPTVPRQVPGSLRTWREIFDRQISTWGGALLQSIPSRVCESMPT